MRLVRWMSAIAILGSLSAVTLARAAGTSLSSVAVVSSSNPSTFGHALSLTGTVTPLDATGAVTFYDGVNPLGTQPLAGGSAMLVVTQLAPGAHQLHAYYAGDATYAPSTSPSISQTVNASSGNGFLDPQIYPMGNWATSVAVGDLNSDGIPDLAVSIMNYLGGPTPDGVNVLFGNGDGTFQNPVNVPMGLHPEKVALADCNGDGHLDLIISNWGAFQSGTTISVALGDGHGNFAPPTEYSTGGVAPWGFVVGDFNRDGNIDLAVVNENTDNIGVLLGDGNGGFLTAVTYPVGHWPAYLATGDLNGDGIADLVVANAYSDSLSVLLGVGDGTFLPQQVYSTGSQPVPILIQDFNGDSQPDVVIGFAAHGSGNTVGVLLNDAGGGLQGPLLATVGTAPDGMAVSDFNGDGNADVVVANYYSNDVTVLLGNGDGTFQPPISYPDGLGPFAVTAGEFNQDGVADFVLANRDTDDIYVFLGKLGTKTTTTATLVSSLNPAYEGQSVRLTATVDPATATGSVTFYDGGSALGTSTLASGVATLTPASWTAGSHNLTAVYAGDSAYASSTSAALNQTILARAQTTIALTVAPHSSRFGLPVNLTATVNSATATGSVTFYDGGSPLAVVPVSAGVAAFSLTWLQPGNHSITAAYGGDTYNAPSSSPAVGQFVDNWRTKTNLLAPHRVIFSAVPLTAKVSPPNAKGDVAFYLGSTLIGRVWLSDGVASMSYGGFLWFGTYEFTAVYEPETGYYPSSDSAVVRVSFF